MWQCSHCARYAKTKKKYEAYCLNDNTLGWNLPSGGQGAGGGWEIVHTLSGGWFPSDNNGRTSNYDLRHGKKTKIYPLDISKSGAPTYQPDLKVKTSQMSNGWGIRALQKKTQWIKFSAAYYGNDRNGGSVEGRGRRDYERQDNHVMLFADGKGSMGYFFNDGKGGFKIRSGWSGWSCRTLPFRVAMEVRGPRAQRHIPLADSLTTRSAPPNHHCTLFGMVSWCDVVPESCSC